MRNVKNLASTSPSSKDCRGPSNDGMPPKKKGPSNVASGADKVKAGKSKKM